MSLAEAKLHLRVEHTADDALIDSLIKSARERVEERRSRVLVTQTWDLFLDSFPSAVGAPDVIEIPVTPLSSVTSVKYIDTDGVQQTVDAGDYDVDNASAPARIAPAFGKAWPAPRSQLNAVEVRFVAGYGAVADVPATIIAELKALLAQLYEHRDDATPLGRRVRFA